MIVPPDTAVEAVLASRTQIVRRIDIYEANAVSPWMLDMPFVDGTVSLSLDRSERRTLDLTLDNSDGVLAHDPEGFWYDKIIKPYRGVRSTDGVWLAPLGVFMIDDISSQFFPSTISVKGRDFAKKLLNAKFVQATTFALGMDVDQVIKAIALNGGIVRTNIPDTGKSLTRDFTFERGTERWKAITDISTAYGYEVFFDSDGVMVMQEYKDPTYSPADFTFAGGADGTLATFEKSSRDTRLRNHIVVTGGASDTLPVFAEARNDDPESPTNIARIGDRPDFVESEFITTYEQARDVAVKRMRISALEEFEIRLGSLVIPWLEPGDIVAVEDPTATLSEPDRFLLSDLTIPLKLGPMNVTGKRVIIVGEARIAAPPPPPPPPPPAPGAPITFVGTVQTTSYPADTARSSGDTTTTVLDVTIPGGDNPAVLLCCSDDNQDYTITPPAGWVEVLRYTSGGVNTAERGFWVKAVDAGAQTTEQWTRTGSGDGWYPPSSFDVLRFEGVDPTNPVLQHARTLVDDIDDWKTIPAVTLPEGGTTAQREWNHIGNMSGNGYGILLKPLEPTAPRLLVGVAAAQQNIGSGLLAGWANPGSWGDVGGTLLGISGDGKSGFGSEEYPQP